MTTNPALEALDAFDLVLSYLTKAQKTGVATEIATIRTTLTEQAAEIERLKRGCPAEYAGPFFAYDFMPQKIQFKSSTGDTMALDVLSVRGWGHLTGKGGGLGINPEAAAKIQDNFGQWVVQTLNAALTKDTAHD